MKLEVIEPIAEKYKSILEPYCKRIEIAGSIRRRKLDCGDIELVIIRDMEKIEELKRIVGKWEKVKGSIKGKYIQVVLPEDLKLDVFIAADDGSNWGNIYLIRTGNWKFSRYMMGIRAKQVGLLHRGGYLIDKDGKRLECREEQDVFDLLKMKYIEPEDRSWE